MSCGSDFFTSNCVCDTLLAIVEAQDKISPIVNDTECEFGCERAIRELVGGVETVVPGPDTIPVILICKNTCAPFKGVGVRRGTAECPFDVVTGCVFRVVEVDPETCCATLEILEKTDSCTAGKTKVGGGIHVDVSDTFDCVKHLENAGGLTRTGVCITIDLNCFCGVSCIFPQNTLAD